MAEVATTTAQIANQIGRLNVRTEGINLQIQSLGQSLVDARRLSRDLYYPCM